MEKIIRIVVKEKYDEVVLMYVEELKKQYEIVVFPQNDENIIICTED